MKKFLFVLLVALISCKPFQMITGSSYEKSEIISVEGSSKDQIYIKANEWMVKIFNNAKSVIQFQDKEEGRIIGKYLLFSNLKSFQYGTVGGDIFAILNIYVKDGAAKISILPQGYWQYDPSGATIYSYGPEQANTDINVLINDFKNFITKKESVW